MLRIFESQDVSNWMREDASGVPESRVRHKLARAPRLATLKEVTARVYRWLPEQAPGSRRPPIARIRHFQRQIARRDPATTRARRGEVWAQNLMALAVASALHARAMGAHLYACVPADVVVSDQTTIKLRALIL